MTEFFESKIGPLSEYRADFLIMEGLADQMFGMKLFTVMEVDLEAGVAWRVYSTDPVSYPHSGQKPLVKNQWYEIVIERQLNFVANTIEEIAAVFPDHELIQSLGCESCLNMPIVSGGRTIGTWNFLDVKGHFTTERVSIANTLKNIGVQAMSISPPE